MKYIKVGEKVNYDGVTLLCCGSEGNKPKCNGCFFSDTFRDLAGLIRMSCCTHGFACTAAGRQDKHHVIFIKL